MLHRFVKVRLMGYARFACRCSKLDAYFSWFRMERKSCCHSDLPNGVQAHVAQTASGSLKDSALKHHGHKVRKAAQRQIANPSYRNRT
eukprot:5666019-Pleurochrysis_carterae.AAC.1